MPKHPEHIDAFMAYLAQYDFRKSVRDVCLLMLRSSPYDYVQGEMWHVLARFLAHPKTFGVARRTRLIVDAIDVMKRRDAGVSLKWGAAHFLCAAESVVDRRLSKFLNFQKSAVL